jgi:hypothetical protein
MNIKILTFAVEDERRAEDEELENLKCRCKLNYLLQILSFYLLPSVESADLSIRLHR